MRNFDDQREKQGLLRVVSKTKEVAPKLIEKGWNLIEAGQSALDLATNIEKFSEVAPTGFFRDPMLNHIVGGLREFNSAALDQYGQITEDENLNKLSTPRRLSRRSRPRRSHIRPTAPTPKRSQS